MGSDEFVDLLVLEDDLFFGGGGASQNVQLRNLVARKLEVCPGSEFRVACEEAFKYDDNVQVKFGDRPVQLKEMDDVDMLTRVIQDMSKQFPTLMETLVHERDHTPSLLDRKKMKMSTSGSMGGSRRRVSSGGLGGVLKEQKTRLYIIRRCVVMLLRWQD
ncbi:hypothetical protein RHMOL_Rhmol09G0163900 [Rhododendron molle]|uniref:Uncharacterized protein n=1 Tax=Rhododendron molle TaxID=49168 RepID=A0ACC0MFT5_RHOML|nr:hypothetical protein RHMOL_Rhmol09G0163900 [Rhododendron molle]